MSFLISVIFLPIHGYLLAFRDRESSTVLISGLADDANETNIRDRFKDVSAHRSHLIGSNYLKSVRMMNY
jgi:hypothetical protein